MQAPPDDATTHLIGQVQTVDYSGVDVVVIDGPDRGKRGTLGPGRVRVGSSVGCQIRLTDPTVSRVHCEVQLRADGVHVADSGSTNGTTVEGVRIFDALLPPGAVLRLGATALRFERSDEPVHMQISALDRFGGILGGSVEMRRMYSIIERVAPTDATVLVQGETGTGKELVARAIHEASSRAAGPFVAMDCGALGENIIESELFGHVRGAFTGAVADRIGLLEEASGGTLFLDEIGELSMALQPKLLRALESREVRRLGSNVSRSFDARVLAATNRPLERSVNEGTFRDDLYYRLAVVEIHLPPLRARREDIPMLAAHFIEKFCGTSEPLPAAFLEALSARSWPGNVRELRNFVERTVSLGWAPAKSDAQVPTSPTAGIEGLVPSDMPLREARAAWAERFEGAYLRALFAKTGGNVTRAAELAGVNRRTLHRMIANLGLRGTFGADDDE